MVRSLQPLPRWHPIDPAGDGVRRARIRSFSEMNDGQLEPPCDLASKVRYLVEVLSPRDGPVETLETHMSWLVLGRAEVFKLKKPERVSFLDLSTLNARERNAREEVRLNRRLAPTVYLGVLALTWNGRTFALHPADVPGPKAVTVDWVVHMRRLPADRMLDTLIGKDGVSVADVAALADVLVSFYRAVRTVRLDGEGVLNRMRQEHGENRRVLLDPRFVHSSWHPVLQRYEASMGAQAGNLAARASDGSFREGHGDLRPEHVCILAAPVVIDCLEFDPQLRELDPFDEIAFLGLECAMLNAPWIGSLLSKRCAASLDEPPAPLFHVYTARRALLRARLMVAHLLDPSPRTPERWLPRADAYIDAASRALTRLDR